MTNGSDTYRTLFDLYVSGYRATSTSLRSKEENQKIETDISAFGKLCADADNALAGDSSGKGGGSDDSDIVAFLTASLGNLQGLFKVALEWDAAHVKAATVLDQAKIQKIALAQEATDQELVSNFKSLIAKVATALDSGSVGPQPIIPAPRPSDSTIKKAAKSVGKKLASETGDLTKEMVIQDAEMSGLDAPYDELVSEQTS